MGCFLGMEIFFLLVCFILVCPFGMCIKDKSHTIRMAKKLLLINDELTKCLSELSNIKVHPTSFKGKNTSDPKLTALESELFGNIAASRKQQNHLGVLYPNEEHGTKSYHTVYDGDLTESLKELQSCLKGGMYGPDGKQTDVFFHREEISIQYNSNPYTLIIHKTKNKDDELKVCSVSFFQKTRFIAYLFSTNDPLAFDNFNCYNGCAGHDKKSELKSVEQLVFCEGKATMNLRIVKNMDPRSFYREMKQNAFFNKDRVLKVLKTTGNDPLSNQKHLSDYNTLNDSIDPKEKTKPRQLKEKLIALFEAEFSADYWTRFHSAYITYFEGKMQQDHDLLPFKHYKTVGRDVCAVGEFLTSFEKVSLTYVLSSRMRQLQVSQRERILVSAMVPSCVIECSKDDCLWAYMVNEENEKDDLTFLIANQNWNRMFEMIHDATAFQDAFVGELSHHIETNDYQSALNMLFYTDNEMKEFRATHKIVAAKPKDNNAHRLGLSERILQSLWTRQLVFPEPLIFLISAELAKHGLTYSHYTPELRQSSRTALDISRSIGHGE
jgi:hypothetical protein